MNPPAFEDLLKRHYAPVDLGARVMAMLRQAGKDPHHLTRDDLATFDEFHTGGRESTRELARAAGLQAEMRVLDVGSGVGGPARTLAGEFGCHVAGLDLTEEFCRVAGMLTHLVGLSDRVTFYCADALDMPFAGGTFDVVWSQNTIMNIADKVRLLREVHRVLRANGVFAFETALAGKTPGMHFPTFWASSTDMNFLVPADTMRNLLGAAGFSEIVWNDQTDQVLASARRRLSSPSDSKALGRAVIVATDVRTKLENSVRNAEDGHVVSIQAVYRR